MFGFASKDEYDIDESQEMFRGILIVGHYHDRGRIKRFLKKYWDRETIGWVIQNRLAEVDLSKPKKESSSYGRACVGMRGQKKIVLLAYDLSDDELFWTMGHELGHLYGYSGTQSGERAADDFADEHIYRRPRYRYSEAKLKTLKIGETMHPKEIFSDAALIGVR